MKLTTKEKLENLEHEIELLQKKLKQELEKEALAVITGATGVITKEHKSKKIFRASRITAYKLQLLTNKAKKIRRIQSRFDSSGLDSYQSLLQTQARATSEKDLEIKRAIVKNLHANIVERVIAGDVAKAQELLSIKNKLEKELAKKGI